jgi:hypothetical protein
MINWAISPSNSLCLLATNGPTPGVVGTGHNISPRLRKQLVLELKVGVEAFEVIEELPGSFYLGQAMPLDKDLSDAPPELSM